MKAIFRNDNASNGNQSDVRVEIRRGQEVNNPVLECTLQIGYMVHGFVLPKLIQLTIDRVAELTMYPICNLMQWR